MKYLLFLLFRMRESYCGLLNVVILAAGCSVAPCGARPFSASPSRSPSPSGARQGHVVPLAAQEHLLRGVLWRGARCLRILPVGSECIREAQTIFQAVINVTPA